MNSPPPRAGVPVRRRRRSSAPLGLFLAVTVGLVGAFGVIKAANEQTSEIERIDGLETVLQPQDGPALNYLLIGSDTRENADPNDPDFASVGDSSVVQGRRSDTIMILRQERDGNGASIVSLPRDLWVDVVGRDGSTRINAAYNDGPDVLAATITREFGIPINHVVDIDFSGFKDLVDAAGGTEICFEYPTRDLNTGLDQQPGCRTLDGVEALQYARSRKYQEFIDGEWREDPRSDLGRIERQQVFLQSIAASTIAQLQSDPFIASDLIYAASQSVRMDPELDPVGAAGTLRKAFSAGLNRYQLPVVGVTKNGAAVLLLDDGADAILDYFRGTGPPPPVEQ